MAEDFVRILKRDYVRVNPKPEAHTVIERLPGWLARYKGAFASRDKLSPPQVDRESREALSAL